MSDAFKARLAQLSPQQLQLLALDMRARLDRLQAERKEPIAVVGLSCRYPGAETPDAFWTLIRDGGDAIREIPRERWPIDSYYDANPDARGKMATRWGGFLERMREFDADFFGISPREAKSIDPQQRLLLEVAWEALESAGIAPDSLRGTKTGVFVGACSGDYFQLSVSRGFESFDTYLATGASNSVTSGRLSYVLGLEGPAVTLDTACSSSLTAVHLAVRSLRGGECRAAIAGGVNILAWPGGTIAMSRGRTMAADGRCKAFDARADGFVRAEGCGVVVLKRLSDAVADGDIVLAVIRGSAVNQDGRSNGLTAPNGRSQINVITDALDDAGVAPAMVSYVEAHGTGTPLGDPIELHALGAALSPNRATDDPVLVGSVKTNIGHSEAAAGVAGLIKTVLMLRHGQIAPSLHFSEPNPFIEWDRIPVTVANTLRSWTPKSGRRIAGVSAFGFSGSNAHVIVEEAPAAAARTASPTERPVHVFPWSARTEGALRTLAGKYADRVAGSQDSVADLSFAAGTGRARLEHRAAIVARSREELGDQLRAFASDDPSAGAIRGQVASTEAPKIAFLYTGTGAQHAKMGAALLRTEPVFREALERCASLIDARLPFPLIESIYESPDGDDRVHDMAFSQPATLAVQYALTELWRSWGIVPFAAMGHSLGEFGAAWAAGAMSIEDALTLVVERARLQASTAAGAMVSVFADVDAVAPYLAANPGIAVGALNGADNVVLSGPAADMDRVAAAIADAGIEVRKLAIGFASHSSLMDPILDEFERAAARVTLRAPERLLISNLTGTVAGSEITHAAYWRRHIREPVRFADGMAALAASGVRTFVEVGPHPSLISMARRTMTDPSFAWVASLRRDTDAAEQMANALGALYVNGAPVDFRAVSRGTARKVALPTYPFERESFWLDDVPDFAEGGLRARGLPGRRLDAARGPVVVEGSISRDELPWLDAHRVNGRIIAPGPLFVDLALAAVRANLDATLGDVVDLRIRAPLALGDDETRRVQTVLDRAPGGDVDVEILSRGASGEWTLHATCTVARVEAPATAPDVDGERQEARAIDVARHYALVESLGIAFGPEFRRLESLRASADDATGSVSILEQPGLSGPLHTAVIDGVLHAVGGMLAHDSEPYLMTGADRIFVSAEPPAGMSLDVYARLRPRAAGDAERIADVWARDGRGRTVVALTGVHLRQARGHSSGRESTYGVTWRDTPALPKQTVRASDRCLIVGAPSALRDALAERIRAAAGNVEILNVEALSPDDASLEQRLGAAVAGSASGAPTKILFVARPSASDEESLANDLDETCGAALALCRAMIARGATAKLWFVASGAAPVAASSSNTVAGALFGFGRSMANEHPSLWGGLIDVDGDTPANSASAVLDEVLSDTRDGEVALVSGKRFVARFARLDWPERSEPLALRGDATYVVTGAFGGIGRKLVSRLVERGARRLALFVRRAPSDSERATLDELAQAGTNVRILRVDVGNESDVVRGLEALRADGTPIAGIFHVAGIYNDAVIERMDWPRFASVLGPKLLAAWYLHRHTAGDPLEHFVMFGSGASLLGPVGLSNYAAANAGLDALAHRRRELGLPALTVDWGPWEDTGMAAAVGSVRRGQWADAGFSPMSSDEAFSILESLMNGGPAQAAAFPVEWGVFRASQTGRHALFADFDRPSANSDSRNELPAHASIAISAASLAALSPDDRVARLTEYLRGEIARELGVRAERVSLTKPINALGFDSLMAVQLRNRAQQALDITIPVSRFIDGSTCEQLARDFVRAIEAAAPAAQPAPEISVDALSDADVDRMLRELLAE